MPLTTLPNGLVLETTTENEAKIIYREQFETNVYLRGGITVEHGATIFDVGANVGGLHRIAGAAVPGSTGVSLRADTGHL